MVQITVQYIVQSLAMCKYFIRKTVVQIHTQSDPFYLSLFMVILGHMYRWDEEQKQSSGGKDRIAHHNWVQRDAHLSWAVLFFYAILLTLHLYRHVRFTFMPHCCLIDMPRNYVALLFFTSPECFRSPETQ